MSMSHVVCILPELPVGEYSIAVSNNGADWPAVPGPVYPGPRSAFGAFQFFDRMCGKLTQYAKSCQRWLNQLAFGASSDFLKPGPDSAAGVAKNGPINTSRFLEPWTGRMAGRCSWCRSCRG